MTIEQINMWFHFLGCDAGKQTFLFSTGTQWQRCHIPDDEEAKLVLCDMVWEASLIKSPVLLKEVLSPTFALHFDIEAKGYTENRQWSDMMKIVAVQIGKCLSRCYRTLTRDGFSAECVIYTTSPVAGQAQVVFPTIVVDLERHHDLRGAVINELATWHQMDDLLQMSDQNTPVNLIKSIPEDLAIPVPLAKLENTIPMDAWGDLKPLAFAVITSDRVGPKKAPGDGKMAWTLLGLKRRNLPKTEGETLPRVRKGKKMYGSSPTSRPGAARSDTLTRAFQLTSGSLGW